VEELYWKGFVLDYTFSSKIASSLYSSVLFISSHLLIWGVFSLIPEHGYIPALELLFGAIR